MPSLEQFMPFDFLHGIREPKKFFKHNARDA